MSSLSFPARWLLPLLLCLGLPACAADDVPVDYVGQIAPPSGKDTVLPAPYVAGQATCTSTAPTPPALVPVETSPCSLTLPAGTGLPGLAVRDGHILVGLGTKIAAFTSSAQGCPAAPLPDEPASVLAVNALAAGPSTPDDLLWVASVDGVAAIDAEAQNTVICDVALATGLAALPTSSVAGAASAVAIDGGARFYSLTVSDSDEGPVCDSPSVALPAGELATAVASTTAEGTIWLATLRDNCGPIAFVGRYDLTTGELASDAPVFEGRQTGLCRVSALLEVDDRLIILDGGCPQILVVDPTSGSLLSRTKLSAGQTPLALAPATTGGALALLSSPGLQGATLSFLRIP